jgi:TRAP-type C4-dicarboxylate transport system substrate-binding protein
MKSIRLWASAISVSLALAFSIASASAAEPQMKIKMAVGFGKQSILWDGLAEVPAKLIENATQGRVKVDIYPSDTLSTGKDRYRALQTGVIDFGYVFQPYNPGLFPIMDLFQLPGLFDNMSVSNAVLNELFKKYPQFERQFDPSVTRVKHISSQIHMRSDVHMAVPVNSVADLKGKVIGAQEQELADALKSLGASPSVIANAEMYTSVERKVIDGVACAWGSVEAFRFYEVTKYHLLISICPGVSHYVMNLNTWNKLNKEEQERILLSAPWMQNALARTAVASVEKARFELCTPERGHRVLPLSAEEAKDLKSRFRPAWNKWAKDMEAKGIPGGEILRETEKLVAAYSSN